MAEFVIKTPLTQYVLLGYDSVISGYESKLYNVPDELSVYAGFNVSLIYSRFLNEILRDCLSTVAFFIDLKNNHIIDEVPPHIKTPELFIMFFLGIIVSHTKNFLVSIKRAIFVEHLTGVKTLVPLKEHEVYDFIFDEEESERVKFYHDKLGMFLDCFLCPVGKIRFLASLIYYRASKEGLCHDESCLTMKIHKLFKTTTPTPKEWHKYCEKLLEKEEKEIERQIREYGEIRKLPFCNRCLNLLKPMEKNI